MEKRSLFSKIFGSDKSTTPPPKSTEVQILDGNKAVFTRYKGDFYNDPDVITCVDTIARNAAKLHPKHIRNYFKTQEDGTKISKLETLNDNIYKILAKQPNEIQNAFKFYYQVVYQLELYNNAIIFVSRNNNLELQGLYPVEYSEVQYYEYADELWIKFKFGRSGKERFVPYKDCIHLTRFVEKDGMFGGTNKPLTKVLSMKHILDEGIINAIKITQSIKGILKSTKSVLKPEDVKKMRDQFIKDFIDGQNELESQSETEMGIGGLDATQEFTPVKIEPTTASDSQIKNINDKVLSYFGLNENIIQSKFSENEWNAFYENIIEPIGLQMSLEFSNKIFTPTEKNFGNEIVFESNRLQYASNNTKITLIRYCSNIMTVNEQREVLNLSPVDGGDVFIIDQNHTIVDNQNDSDNINDEGEDKNEKQRN